MFIFHSRRFLILITIPVITIACLFVNVEEKGKAILDSIPIYEGAKLLGESRTTYPDSTPSVIREYQSQVPADELMAYYQSTLTEQEWSLQVWDTSDPYVPREILAQKDGWRVSILVYSTGKFTLRVFLN